MNQLCWEKYGEISPFFQTHSATKRSPCDDSALEHQRDDAAPLEQWLLHWRPSQNDVKRGEKRKRKGCKTEKPHLVCKIWWFFSLNKVSLQAVWGQPPSGPRLLRKTEGLRMDSMVLADIQWGLCKFLHKALFWSSYCEGTALCRQCCGPSKQGRESGCSLTRRATRYANVGINLPLCLESTTSSKVLLKLCKSRHNTFPDLGTFREGQV